MRKRSGGISASSVVFRLAIWALYQFRDGPWPPFLELKIFLWVSISSLESQGGNGAVLLSVNQDRMLLVLHR